MEWILSRSDSPQIKEAGRASEEEDSGKNRKVEAVLGERECSARAAPPSRNLPKERRVEAQLRRNRSPRAQPAFSLPWKHVFAADSLPRLEPGLRFLSLDALAHTLAHLARGGL